MSEWMISIAYGFYWMILNHDSLKMRISTSSPKFQGLFFKKYKDIDQMLPYDILLEDKFSKLCNISKLMILKSFYTQSDRLWISG